MRKPSAPQKATKIPGKVPPMPPAKPMKGPQKATKISMAFESSMMDKKMDAGKPKGWEGSKADKMLDMKGMKSMGKRKGG